MSASFYISTRNGARRSTGKARPLGDMQPMYALGKVLIAMQGLTYEERSLVLTRAKVLVDASKKPTVERRNPGRKRGAR